jgi:chromosome segregation ATPase
MISGRQALAQIEQTIEKARQQEAQCGRVYAAATAEVGRLRLQRTESFRELARLKLDAITQDKVIGHLDAAERQAVNLLNNRQEALRQLTERRRQEEERMRQAEAERQAAMDTVERALAEVDAVRKDVEAKVSIEADWISARARGGRAYRTGPAG